MKKLFFILFLLPTLFIIRYEAKSTCPNEYDFQMTIGGCVYNVQVCYICPSPGGNGEVKVMGFSKADISCDQALDIYGVYSAICSYVFSTDFISAHLCQPPVPPCETGGINYEYVYDHCWYKLNIEGSIWYSPCYTGNCLCRDYWKYCFSPGPPPGIIAVHILGPQWACNYECNDPEPPDPIVPGTQTTCFGIKTPCN